MTHLAVSDNRSCQRPVAATIWQSSASYCGAKLCNDL